MKEHPILFRGDMVRALLSGVKTQTRRVVRAGRGDYSNEDGSPGGICPYGVVGDRLWVRETFVEIAGRAHHRAGGNLHFDGKPYTGRWRPSIHMPRWACRLTLTVTDVRVECLRDITEVDAKAEGFDGREDFALESGLDWEANPWVWVVGFRRAVTP